MAGTYTYAQKKYSDNFNIKGWDPLNKIPAILSVKNTQFLH